MVPFSETRLLCVEKEGKLGGPGLKDIAVESIDTESLIVRALAGTGSVRPLDCATYMCMHGNHYK